MIFNHNMFALKRDLTLIHFAWLFLALFSAAFSDLRFWPRKSTSESLCWAQFTLEFVMQLLEWKFVGFFCFSSVFVVPSYAHNVFSVVYSHFRIQLSIEIDLTFNPYLITVSRVYFCQP